MSTVPQVVAAKKYKVLVQYFQQVSIFLFVNRERGVKYKARHGDVKQRCRRRQEKDRKNTEERHT